MVLPPPINCPASKVNVTSIYLETQVTLNISSPSGDIVTCTPEIDSMFQAGEVTNVRCISSNAFGSQSVCEFDVEVIGNDIFHIKFVGDYMQTFFKPFDLELTFYFVYSL